MKTKRDKEIVQTSKILALQITEILHKCNYLPLSRYYENKILTPNNNKRKTVYAVNWEKPTSNKKNRKGRWVFEENNLCKIKEVNKKYYSGYVYNLEVAGDHTYVVQNILVHNCYGTKFVLGWEQYFNPRRSDGRIMVRFSPAEDDVKRLEAGLESEFNTEVWTLTVPTVKDRDILVRFDQDGNEEFRYEVMSVTRNKTIAGLQGGQRMRVQRIRKTDRAYQIKAFKNTGTTPTKLSTSIGFTPGIPPHTHDITITNQPTSNFNQLTSVNQGHNHIVIYENGQLIVKDVLGHDHKIII